MQIATQAFEATWREPEGEERHDVWAFMTHLFPPYLAYQRSTSRHIPVVMLKTGRPIDVFTAERWGVVVGTSTRVGSPLGPIGESHSTTEHTGLSRRAAEPSRAQTA